MSYTQRIFRRHGWCSEDATYHDLQQLCAEALNEKPLPEQLDYWQDFHAQLVAIGNSFCRPRAPHCDECPLKGLLPKRRCGA